MTDSRRRQLFLAASVVLSVVPFAFGVIRAVSTGADRRYLWLAGAAILGSMGVVRLMRGASGGSLVLFRRALAAVAAGAISAGVTAILMGARAGPGVAVVAIAFGLCTGTGVMFATLAKRNPHE